MGCGPSGLAPRVFAWGLFLSLCLFFTFFSLLTADGISNAAIDRLSEVEDNAKLDLLPSLQKTIRAVQQLSSGKAPGADAIPAEIFKHGGPQLITQLTVLFQAMWRQGQVNQDFKDSTIVQLYKKKGNRQLCVQHREISLLNNDRKMFTASSSILSLEGDAVSAPSWHYQHDLYHASAAGEVSRYAKSPLRNLCGSDESLTHGESRKMGKVTQ
ncbi:unnamed protein product [Schistocephalus solidus]|uniref:Transmembrane protein n=1 Tax=Schistocephalus solidus TaxID=70667 RepID=A0A183T0Y1_SCHSO|nr:unnamed protein product [Schistocephalus solidus]